MRRIYAEGIATGDATFETEVPDRRTLDHPGCPTTAGSPRSTAQVVGWAAAKPVSSRAVYAGVAETSIYVGDGYRGRGVGKALIHRQVTAADDAGLWTLQTSIFPENRASIALHQSAGFRTLGLRERIGRHHGLWRDTVFLERRRADDAHPGNRPTKPQASPDHDRSNAMDNPMSSASRFDSATRLRPRRHCRLSSKLL